MGIIVENIVFTNNTKMNRVFILSLLVALVSGREHHRRLEARVRNGEKICGSLVKAMADMEGDTDLEWCACEFEEADGTMMDGFPLPMKIDTGDQNLDCPAEGARICMRKKTSFSIQEADKCGDHQFINSDTYEISLDCVEVDIDYEVTRANRRRRRY